MKQDKEQNLVKEEDFDTLVASALCKEGRGIPITPEEVTETELQLHGIEIELPESLQDPLSFLDRQRHHASVFSFPNTTHKDASKALASAARAGKEISENVRETMKRDRKQAETIKDKGR